jgi:hypothetical protein
MVTAALVVMTILGCDDSVSQCHYVDTVKGSWETVEACDAHSQQKLPAYGNANYPVVVAMCEKTGDAPIASAADPVPKEPAGTAPRPSTPDPRVPPVPDTANADTGRPALPQRALAMIKGVLPDAQRIRSVITAPVHTLGDGYAWVATRIAR